MAELNVEIVTPAKVAFQGTAGELQAPGLLGEFGVLPTHANMLAVTRAGVVTLHNAGGAQRLVVGAGFAEVGPGQVTLLVNSCEEAADVDKAAARVSLDAAQQRLIGMQPDAPDYAGTKAEIEIAQVRLDS
mgnify:CR=1 FL=1